MKNFTTTLGGSSLNEESILLKSVSKLNPLRWFTTTKTQVIQNIKPPVI